MADYMEIARRAMERHQQPHPDPTPRSGLKGRAVELWTDGMGRTFLVADEADRQRVIQQFGAGQGETMTEAELELVASITDPKIRREVMQWKRTFNGKVSDYQEGKP